MNKLLTETEVATALSCTKGALRKWRRENRGPRFVRMGRMIRYRAADVEAFVTANTAGPSGGAASSLPDFPGLRPVTH